MSQHHALKRATGRPRGCFLLVPCGGGLRAVSFSALSLDGSLCLLIKLLPFSELAQEPGQGWAHEDLGRQRRGMWPGPVIPETCSAHTVGTEARGLSPGLVDGWKEHLPVFTVKKKFKKHIKPQVHVFSNSLESWLQLTPHLRRQVAAKETRCKQWLPAVDPAQCWEAI